MIINDAQLEAMQEKIHRFERFLAEARKKEPAANYRAMAGAYLAEIDQMRSEIRTYLSNVPEKGEAV